MSIYPYVYRIDHPSGEFYIGYRVANKVPAELDIGFEYKTSSKHLSYPFEEYSITVVAEFFTNTAKDDAYEFEQALIFEHWGDLQLANKSCYHGKKKFRVSGPMSNEHRKRISESSIGRKSPNKGRQLSEETKKKMSQSRQGQKRGPMSNEQRIKISNSRKGQTQGPMSEEHKQKIANSLRGKKYSPLDEKHKKKISEAKKGKQQSEDHIRKRTESRMKNKLKSAF